MSDSDCSNCEKIECEFRNYGYDCYVRKIESAQKHMTKSDVQILEKTVKRLKELYDLTDIDSCDQATAQLETILQMQKGK